ncbi:sulfur carrier protein ThiS [Phaeobacter gallaeciensis]|uniref:sulfur carrier protein ThiS n=1 Tax=Phaeobacter gallaeciensis TaxID=60890 RepID=UPI00237F77DA|nr:sulfur carrier protein ThiS [Phaeobacter gallaeciensis]MDE4191628.1 sulfur carrier protein ThiS [Phaeobacter gallaeciensis]MDE4200091.1 sulfur carrier protein ThiS [Phaeobacter gallaeciensis]MDE4204461.1 sulfur carrier protein ThiS [Phaeobacter gallaeciensis]MDE4208383.1 sulfur carrier protein ThiS [Phaeobacter gallaeciensis]MDE4216970.1 sulfur carrier protein ThiS [Phaeobacter gallaeciensis]
MQIIVNADPRDIRATTLAAALDELGFTSPAIATALNGQFISRAKRVDTRLTAGDRLEVLAPMQGG